MCGICYQMTLWINPMLIVLLQGWSILTHILLSGMHVCSTLLVLVCLCNMLNKLTGSDVI